MDIEIKEHHEDGFRPLTSYGGWRVGIANGCERLLRENIKRLERHNETDEVFVLITGEATLYIGKEMTEYKMELGKVYNVKRGVWHAISMTMDAMVAIVENDDTGFHNSDLYYFEEK